MNGLFGVNGLLGFLIAVVLVVALAIIFGISAVKIQSSNAENYYHIKNWQEIKSKSTENKIFYEDVK